MKSTKISLHLMLLLHMTLRISTRDLSEGERSSRAEFVQRLLNRHKVIDGKIKLVGGTRYQGNVYIHHAGRWGAVCDDSWDDVAAHVVCSMFNRSGLATYASQYGEAKEKFWMDDVVCEGDEGHLSDCKFSGWGSSDCGPSEAAGVICRARTNEFVNKRAPERTLHEVLGGGAAVRLMGGSSENEGRIEIYHNNTWSSICPDGWSLYEALTVCRQLNLGFAKLALQTDVYGSSGLRFSGVKCEGSEGSLLQCKHDMVGAVRCAADAGSVAAVSCTRSLADLQLDTAAIERSAHLQDVMMYQLQCAMEENCLTKSAYEIRQNNPDWQFETRRLLRFTAASLNIGTDDFRPFLPKHLWQWHLCHMHYHSMEVFATFDVLNSTGRVADGHKASFCLEDNTCLPGVEKKYSCKNYGDQGISVNCSDVYQYNIDCQWVDVTDVSPGDYTFKVAVNPHARIPEQQYNNNAAVCQLRLTHTYASVYGCVLQRA